MNCTVRCARGKGGVVYRTDIAHRACRCGGVFFEREDREGGEVGGGDVLGGGGEGLYFGFLRAGGSKGGTGLWGLDGGHLVTKALSSP